jgi:NADPH:quinone reductase-like Zn-dependent oxidoreductase
MRAAQIIGYGGAEVMQTVADVPKPAIAAGQVLVAVRAAGVNPFDVKVRAGLVQAMKALEFPATLGGDFAGVVAEVGADVTGVKVGDEVYGQAGPLSGVGSFAEFTPVVANQVGPKPKTVDFVTAAALPLAGVSAYQALVDHLDLQTGQKILIHGGAGGIGSLAVQLAKHLGAWVTATAAAQDAGFVKELGADEVIDYTSQDFTAAKDYDAVFDTVGGDTNQKSYQVVKRGGMLVSMAAQADEALVKRYDIRYVSQFTKVTPERLAALAKLVDQGVLKVQIDKLFPLEEATGALSYLETGHPRGKVVLRVQ